MIETYELMYVPYTLPKTIKIYKYTPKRMQPTAISRGLSTALAFVIKCYEDQI